jgi:hypothetical protein
MYVCILQIVDAESCEELQEDAVGEIWIRSESKVSAFHQFTIESNLRV